MLTNIYLVKRARKCINMIPHFQIFKELNLQPIAYKQSNQNTRLPHYIQKLNSGLAYLFNIFKILKYLNWVYQKAKCLLLQRVSFFKILPSFFIFFPIIKGGHPTHFSHDHVLHIDFLATFCTRACAKLLPHPNLSSHSTWMFLLVYVLSSK